jgi:GGDEF domain-containing protein
MKLEEIEARRQAIRDAVTAFNADPAHPEAQLSLSMGCAAYRPGDQLFREVFVRADEAMYENKDIHHRRNPPAYMR